MQVTIDIPETQYREFETRAAQQRRPLGDVVLSETLRAETEEQFQERMRNRYPLIKDSRSGPMVVPEDGFNEAMFAPNDEAA